MSTNRALNLKLACQIKMQIDHIDLLNRYLSEANRVGISPLLSTELARLVRWCDSNL